MRKFLKIAYVMAAILFLGSCEDFLDKPAPTTAVSADDVFTTPDGARAYFNGIYRNMRTQWRTSTDTWGNAAAHLARIVKGIDVMIPSGWYQWDYRHENREPTYRRTNFVWDFYYETGNQANVMIQGLEGSNFPETTKNRMLGEAKALRAWAYFNLVREFQHNDPSLPGVPIYTTPASADATGNARSTVQDVYTFIIDDLQFATSNMVSDRLQKSNINLNVAQGLLARVYLTVAPWMGTTAWEGARDMALAARSGYSLNAAGYSDGFNDIGNVEWMWGMPQSTDQTIYYGNPASHFDHNILGYNSVFINDDFAESFSATDIRAIFVKDAFGAGAAPHQTYITNKFVQKSDFSDDYVMMRMSEMILTEAEARAELGETTAAQNLLFTLQSDRDANASPSGNTGSDLISEILLERRKELYGEIGVSYLDIKRRSMPLIRTGNHPSIYRFNFPSMSDEFNLKIPQAEIDANDNLTEADQND